MTSAALSPPQRGPERGAALSGRAHAQTREIVLTQGHVAIVDALDYETLSQFNWYAAQRARACYAARMIGREMVLMHRVIMSAPKGTSVDHINGNGLDNRRANLRLADASQNGANWQRALGKTGYRGVHFEARRGLYSASLAVKKRKIWLGYHRSAEAAARAYDAGAKLHHGVFARLNFPDEAEAA